MAGEADWAAIASSRREGLGREGAPRGEAGGTPRGGAEECGGRGARRGGAPRGGVQAREGLQGEARGACWGDEADNE